MPTSPVAPLAPQFQVKAGIRELMARQNISQRQLAARASLSTGYVSQVLNWERYPGTEARQKLMVALGIEFDELFEAVG